MDIDDDARRALRRVIESLGDGATPPPSFEDLRIAATGDTPRRPVRTLVATAGAAAVVVLALVIGLTLGSDDDGRETVTATDRPDSPDDPGSDSVTTPTPDKGDDGEQVTDSDGPATIEPSGRCSAELPEFADLLRTGLFPNDLMINSGLDSRVRSTDLILLGTARSVVRSTFSGPRLISSQWTTITLDDVEILHTADGSQAPTTIAFSSLWTEGRSDLDPLAERVEVDGVRVIAFLEARESAPGGHEISRQGLFLSCPGSAAPPVEILGPLGLPSGVPVITPLDELAELIRSASATVHDRWSRSVDGPVVSLDGGGEALISGVIGLEGNCLYLDVSDGSRYPVVWPVGATWDAGRTAVTWPPAERAPDLEPLAALEIEVHPGDRIDGGGGFGKIGPIRRLLGPAAADHLAACLDEPDGEIATLNRDLDSIRVSVLGSGQPFDDEATVRPDLMQIDPATAAPGDIVDLTFPGRTERGAFFVLERRTDSGWSATHILTALWFAGRGRTWVRFDEPIGMEDIGRSGIRPDRIEIPRTAAAGEHRVCTANARANICVELSIDG